MKTTECRFERIFLNDRDRVGITNDGHATYAVQLDEGFGPAGTPTKLRAAAHVLGLAHGAVWYADEGQSRSGKAIWSLDLRTDQEQLQAACPKGVVPCGVMELPLREASILGLRDDAVVRLSGQTSESQWPDNAGIRPVTLPTVWRHGWSCLCEDAAGNRMLLVGDGQEVKSCTSLPHRTRLACLSGNNRVLCLECTDGGHVARLQMITRSRQALLQLPRGPMWPISIERLCDFVVLHYSSLGRRRAIAIDSAGRIHSFAPWCRPVIRDKNAWLIHRSSPTACGQRRSRSPQLRQVRWTGHRGVAMRGWLWTPTRPSQGAVMRLHGGPGVACDEPWDRWTECLLNAGYHVFQPDVPGSCGYGDTLLQALRGEALVRSVHEEVAMAARVCAQECSLKAEEVSLLGESLGGYLALFAGMKTCDWRPRCIIAVNGFGDLLFDFKRSADATRGVMVELLGTPEQDSLRYCLASATTWAHDDIPPVMLIASAKDANVLPANSTRMRSLLKSAGIPAALLMLAESTHDIFAPQDWAVALNAVKAFLERRHRGRQTPQLIDVFPAIRSVLESQDLFDPSPAASDALATRCVKALAYTNYVLWCLEDEARAPGKALSAIGAIKKRIDACNQRRNDLIADLDAVFAQCRCDATAGGTMPRTESPASALDRLTILALRLRALRGRRGTTSTYRRRAEDEVQLTWRRLLESVTALFKDLQAGRCTFHHARPWKLYNDPMLSVHGTRLETNLSDAIAAS